MGHGIFCVRYGSFLISNLKGTSEQISTYLLTVTTLSRTSSSGLAYTMNKLHCSALKQTYDE